MFTLSNARKQWQEFKKRNPNFEKAKGYKGDFGPTLDKIDGIQKRILEGYDSYAARQREVQALLEKKRTVLKDVAAASRLGMLTVIEYHDVASKSGDLKMYQDFNATVFVFHKQMEQFAVHVQQAAAAKSAASGPNAPAGGSGSGPA